MERVLFNRDILSDCLLPCLSIFDVFSVFQTCKGIREAYARQYSIPREACISISLSLHVFKQRLWKGLSHFYGEKNALRLSNMLDKGIIYLTGGFLLALISGENINTCSDVDFATVLSCYYKQSPKKRREMCKERSAGIVSMLSQASKIHNYESDNQFYKDGFAVDSYSVHGKKLQIIHLQDLSRPKVLDAMRVESYCRWFDFHFCANFFAEDKLVCCFTENVKDRYSNILSRELPWSRFRNMSNEEEMVILNRMMERINKYRAKGYCIDLSELTMQREPHDEKTQIWNQFWSSAKR